MAHSTIVVKKTNQYQICDILQQNVGNIKETAGFSHEVKRLL